MMLYTWISRCWAKEANGKKGKGDKKGKGNGRGKKSEYNTDERDKDNGKKNAKATEYFVGNDFHCKGWGYMKKDLLVERER